MIRSASPWHRSLRSDARRAWTLSVNLEDQGYLVSVGNSNCSAGFRQVDDDWVLGPLGREDCIIDAAYGLRRSEASDLESGRI